DLWRLLVVITVNKVRGQAKFHAADKRALSREQPGATDDDWQGLSLAALAGEPTPLEAAALADEVAIVMRRLDACAARCSSCASRATASRRSRCRRSAASAP